MARCHRSWCKAPPDDGRTKAETGNRKEPVMANPSLPVPVKKALENPVVLSVYQHFAVVVNTTLIRRAGEVYEPRAMQAASAEIN
jgi:hypothetical protein